MIYSVKAYFKRKPQRVYLSKFVGVQPMPANGREMRMVLDHKEEGRNEGGNKIFVPSYLEDNVDVLRSFDSFHVRVLHEIFMFSSIS